jgi:hypothetical protein
VFEGGVLDEETIKQIVLEEKELEAYRFVPLHEAVTLVGAGMVPVLPAALKAYTEGTVEYIEVFT